MRKIRLNKYVSKGRYYEVILTDKKYIEIARAKLDKEDVGKVKICRWGLNRTTRTTQGWVNRRITAMHIIIMGKKKGLIIDHINHDPLDNRRQNLRYVTKSQNGMNRQGVKGVYWGKRENRWIAQIMVNQKHIYLGTFINKEDAIHARKKGEQIYFKEFAYNE